MNNYTIKKDHILLAAIVQYIDFDGYKLIRKEISDDDILHKVVFIDGKIIDFETGDEIQELKRDYEGYIDDIVLANKMYYHELYKCPKVTNKDLLYASKIYEYHLEKQQLIKEKKLIPFPSKQLY